tara:strand:- start:12123 stop:13343 length:1221 start_codon:yes stop_codon:yes gene_type:complete
MDKTNEMFTKTLDVLSANTHLIEILTIVIVVSAMLAIFIYVAFQQAAKQGNCIAIKGLYPIPTNIKSVLANKDQMKYTISDTDYDTRLRDVYVKASYNSCSAGNYKDDWVSTCALNEVLKQGCRFVDFEIYSVNHEPVVATSTTTDYYTKETWNSVPFSSVAKLIKNNAFSSEYVPNNTDPLLVHLRFKSNDILMYNKLADVVKKQLDSFVLDNKYSCSYTGEGSNPANVLDATFSSMVLKQKVIIIVDGASNSTYMDSSFNEYVNLSSSCSSTPTITEYRNFSAQTSETSDSLSTISRAGEIIVLPDLNKSPVNMDCTSTTSGLFISGCQIVGMCFQLKDTLLNNYINFFDSPVSGVAPSAFILKDVSLINPDSTETYPAIKQLSCTTQTQTSKYGDTYETQVCS